MRPHALSLLVLDANNFSRNLIGEILRNLDATDVTSARDIPTAEIALQEKNIDVILLSWENEDNLDGLRFVRGLRRVEDNRIRRLPVIFVTSGLTKQFVIGARDAGVDEFLAKPISPAATRQRLEMVVETPRPFVDSSVYLGPCRRRKNPADYHGDKRRAGERGKGRGSTTIDKDEEAARSPIRISLSNLRSASSAIRGSAPTTLGIAMRYLNESKAIATQTGDHALHAALAAYEAYVNVAAPLGQIEETVINTALNALEQLATLPVSFTEARESVANALGKAIQKKLAA